jgi:hypothetical protein
MPARTGKVVTHRKENPINAESRIMLFNSGDDDATKSLYVPNARSERATGKCPANERSRVPRMPLPNRAVRGQF